MESEEGLLALNSVSNFNVQLEPGGFCIGRARELRGAG
jgi:hypothetical protein